MPLRPAYIKRKGVKSTYAGIYEYYKTSDHDKTVTAYYVAVRGIDDKVRKIKTDAKTKDEALDMLNKLKSENRSIKLDIQKEESSLNRRINQGELTFDDMAKMYYSTRTTKNNIKDTAKYKNHISPLIGSKKVSKFTTENVLVLQTTLLNKIISNNKGEKERTMSPKTVDTIIEQLSAMYNEGLRDKNRWCNHNPVADKDIKKLTKADDKSRLRIFSDDELVKLFDNAEAHPRMYLLMKLLYHTAGRPEAIIELQVKNIDFIHKKVHLKAMKGAPAYNVPMVESVEKLIVAWIYEHKLEREHYIFYPIQTGDKTKPAIYENFRRSSKKIIDIEFNDGIASYDRKYRATLYTLRHTSATKLVEKLGIKLAKEYLNHADIKTTEIYAKVKDIQMREAAYVL